MNVTLYRSWWSLLCVACVYAGSAAAQSYPAKPIRIVIPYGPGGAADVVLRILAPQLSENLGQQVVIDNRPGGAGTIGIDMVARSEPDGYTLGMANLTFAANPFMISKMPYDTPKDFLPVSLVATQSLALAVNPTLPARSVKGLIELAKAKSGSLNYASAGNAASNHLATELFKHLTGVGMTHVPYKSGAAAVLSLLSGETMILFATVPSSLQHFKSGKLIALAVSTAKRDFMLPDIPTVAESGLPGYDVYEWQSLVTPAGAPAAVIQRLNREIVNTLSRPDVKERIAGTGASPVGSTPEELGAHIKREMARWSTVIKAAGIRIE